MQCPPGLLVERTGRAIGGTGRSAAPGRGAASDNAGTAMLVLSVVPDGSAMSYLPRERCIARAGLQRNTTVCLCWGDPREPTTCSRPLLATMSARPSVPRLGRIWSVSEPATSSTPAASLGAAASCRRWKSVPARAGAAGRTSCADAGAPLGVSRGLTRTLMPVASRLQERQSCAVRPTRGEPGAPAVDQRGDVGVLVHGVVQSRQHVPGFGVEHLAAVVSEQAGGAFVELGDPAARVERDEPVGQVVQQGRGRLGMRRRPCCREERFASWPQGLPQSLLVPQQVGHPCCGLTAPCQGGGGQPFWTAARPRQEQGAGRRTWRRSTGRLGPQAEAMGHVLAIGQPYRTTPANCPGHRCGRRPPATTLSPVFRVLL